MTRKKTTTALVVGVLIVAAFGLGLLASWKPSYQTAEADGLMAGAACFSMSAS